MKFNFFENPKIEKNPDLSKDIGWFPTKSKDNPGYLNVTVALRKESPWKGNMESNLFEHSFSKNPEREGNINSTYYGLIREDEFESLKSKITFFDSAHSDKDDLKRAA